MRSLLDSYFNYVVMSNLFGLIFAVHFLISFICFQVDLGPFPPVVIIKVPVLARTMAAPTKVPTNSSLYSFEA